MKRYLMLIFLLMFYSSINVYPDNNGKHVLYISSYHPSFPTFNKQVEGIKSVFDRENISLDIEFIDAKRFPGPENIRIFHQALSFKLRNLPTYDAVIAADDSAVLYAESHTGDLFKNIPVFFCGLNDIDKADKLEKKSLLRGVVEMASMSETLELIRSLFPGRNKLAVITDGTLSGQADLRNFISKSKDFPFKVEILSLQNLTFGELNTKLSGEGDDYTILLLSAYADITGSTRLFKSELSEICQYSHVPVFHLWEHGLGDGIFGGKLIRHFDQGREAAGMVMDYFHGTPPGRINNMKNSPNSYSFDYNQLKRFNIPLSHLPAGSIVINRPLSFFASHRNIIIATAAVIAALLYIVVILLLEGRRLKSMVKKRTEELAESEERWKFSLEGAGQVVWDWDLHKNKIFISRKWNEELGLNNEETLADIEEWFDLIHSDDRERTRSMMEKHLSGAKPLYENFHRIIAKDGTYRWVLSRGKVIERLPDGSPRRVIGTATDVTELKQIEDEISRSRRMLQLVLDTIPIGVFWKNTDMRYMGCNDSFARLIGIESAEHIVGKKDDEIFESELAGSYSRVDREILSTGRPKINYEDQLYLPTGKVRTLRKSKVPLTDNNGEIIGVLGTYEDITAQKNLREEVFRIQKLESVGILASGIAHDFNNLLMAISGSLSVLRISDGMNEKNLYWIEQAEKSCFAATELTTRLITFSRGGAPVLQDENIYDIIREAVDSVSGGAQVAVNFAGSRSLPLMMIDARQIRQVMINLLENARESMPGGGVIDINTSAAVLEPGNRFELAPGNYLVINVKDTGPGIPEAIIDKVFDPYFSTKDPGLQKGQGLGLAICYSIITQHKGKIMVNSVPGNGAVFTIYLPCRM